MSDEVLVRRANPTDEQELLVLDRDTQTPLTSPGNTGPPKSSFFSTHNAASDHLVAIVDQQVVGYVKVDHPTNLKSNQHVMCIGGLAVAPSHHREGIGKALLLAALVELRERGVTKVGLRVLGWNEPAIRLYHACGFEVEGVLRGEFLLDGVLVDDVLMALQIS